MVVDDEPLVLDQLQMLLADKEHVGIVAACATAREALETIAIDVPDIMITDIEMPNMSGIDLIREVRKQCIDPIGTIVLSAYERFDYAKGVMELGVSNYLLKPLFEEDLMRALDRAIVLLEEKRKRDQMQDVFDTHMQSRAEDDRDLQQCMFPREAFIEKAQRLMVDESMALWRQYQRCREEQLNAFSLVLEDAVNLLCDAASRDVFKASFLLEDWIVKLEKAKEVEDVHRIVEAWIEGCCGAIKQGYREQSIKQVIALKDYVDRHYDKNITLTQLAHEFYCNPVYLGQMFNKTFGVHFQEYLKKVRIEKAKELLSTTNLSMQQIAYEVGYENYSVFKNYFTALTNSSPKGYREYTKYGAHRNEEKNG